MARLSGSRPTRPSRCSTPRRASSTPSTTPAPTRTRRSRTAGWRGARSSARCTPRSSTCARVRWTRPRPGGPCGRTRSWSRTAWSTYGCRRPPPARPRARPAGSPGSRMRAVLVVGASLAGLSAARALRAQGYDGRLVVVGDEPHRPYDRPPLSKEFLAGRADEAALVLEADGEDLGAEWLLGARAVTLDPGTRGVGLADGRAVTADGVVIATGAAARTLPGAAGPPVCTPCAPWTTPARCGPIWRAAGGSSSSAAVSSGPRSPRPHTPSAWTSPSSRRRPPRCRVRSARRWAASCRASTPTTAYGCCAARGCGGPRRTAAGGWWPWSWPTAAGCPRTPWSSASGRARARTGSPGPGSSSATVSCAARTAGRACRASSPSATAPPGTTRPPVRTIAWSTGRAPWSVRPPPSPRCCPAARAGNGPPPAVLLVRPVRRAHPVRGPRRGADTVTVEEGVPEERDVLAVYRRGGVPVAVLGMNRPRSFTRWRKQLAAAAS